MEDEGEDLIEIRPRTELEDAGGGFDGVRVDRAMARNQVLITLTGH